MPEFVSLTADEIDEIDDIVIEAHPVPEWGENRGVYVRSIPAETRGRIEGEAALFKEGKNPNFAKTFTIRFAWLGMCDENGQRLYGKQSDIERLHKKNAAVIARIANHVQRLSGFSKEDVENLEKNLNGARPLDSDTD